MSTVQGDHESQVYGQHHHLAEAVVDRRGLTATGAASIALVMGLLGGTFDVITGTGLRSGFAICFVLGAMIAAAAAHREDLVATVVMPPLVYVSIAFAAAALQTTYVAGPWAKQQFLELATSLVLGAPVLITATLAAALVALIRGLRARKAHPLASPASR